MDKALLWGNSLFCLILTLVFVGFPNVLFPIASPESAAIARILGFAYLPFAFLSLLANRLKHNRELLLSAYFTLAMLHFGAALIQGVYSYQGISPAPLAFAHFTLLFFMVFRLYRLITQLAA